MNYARIYQDFISDRQNKQPSKPDYFERHHIVPKSLGGTNEKTNLIRLTPEDHFFAHLLLAKIHGGKLWAPIAFMVGGVLNCYRPTTSRKKYAWLSKELSKSNRGHNSVHFDTKVYEIINEKGEIWVGLQSEMNSDLKISKSLANMLVKGRVKNAKGWSLKSQGFFSTKGENHPMYRKETYSFLHVDGRSFSGTQFEFKDYSKLSKPAIYNLTSKKAKVWNGWFLEGTELPSFGRGAKWKNYLPEQSAI